MGRKHEDEDSSTLKTATKAAVAGKAAKELLTDDDAEERSRGKGRIIALLLAAVGAVGWLLKRRRERELDEALWEEPRAL